MAVVTKYGNAYPDPSNTMKLPDAVYAEATIKSLLSVIAVANGDSATSQLFLGKVPSYARLGPRSTLHHSAITGLNSLDIGFLDNANKFNAMAAALDVTAAGTKSLIAAVPVTDLGKRVWELAGFSADPKKHLDVVMTMNAAATAAGTLVAELYWAWKN